MTEQEPPRPAGFPAPGLRGDYRGACTVCGRGTDTALVLLGEAEFVLAGLVALGLPANEALATLAVGTGHEPTLESGGGMAVTAPAGVFPLAVRVCGGCASKAGLEAWPLSDEVPVYVQPAEHDLEAPAFNNPKRDVRDGENPPE
ncbi:hypothetical protein [Amycolatopsis anabasis]|uniref:hypothetical protein n=1 Tax=Amycolatopsis anabasis TaxID=1840409 RepID=UPI00131B6CEB|nr:hypothetical protein [Amycolatopsis anabasis]